MKYIFKKLSSFLLITLILMSSFSLLLVNVVSAEGSDLPDSVDNSQSKYFPDISSQEDLGACVSWGQTYYQFTYMMNRSMDVETTPENTFSPSFNFNIINGGRGTGAWDKDGYNTMMEIGSVPLKTVPYNTKEWNNWFATEKVWKEAMQYRIKSYTYLKSIGMESSRITSVDDSDLLQIKKLLAQGEVLAATTPIYTWKVDRIKAHSDVPENDKYVNEYVVKFCDKSGQGHRLAVVGYNDNIWTDINGNENVDEGEMGALKIANSWGTERHNKGFMWIAYDALNMTSCVKDCPVSGNYRPDCLSDFVSIEVIPYDSDAELYLRYTLNTADRSQGKVFATAKNTSGQEYTLEVGPKRQHGMTFNKFSYDGSTDANDGTMLFALSNIVPDITSETLHEYTWSIRFEDTTYDGKVFTVKNLEIVDESTGRISKPSDVYPVRLDGSQKTVDFPGFEEYIPVTTTISTVVTTAPATTINTIVTEPTETTMVTETTEPAVTETAPVNTTVTVTTEPTETTTQTTVVSSEATTVTENQTTTSTHTLNTSPAPTNTTQNKEYICGDADNDGMVKIKDATLIQKFCANLVTENSIHLLSADCNADTKVSVKDVTCIQKYLAKLSGYFYVGEVITVKNTTSEEINTSTTTTADAITTQGVSSDIITEPAGITTETTALPDPTESTVPVTEVILPTAATTYITAPTVSQPVTTNIVTPTVEVTESVSVTTEATEPVATTEALPVIKDKVIFTNSFGWQGTISCYYWSDSDMSMTKWPGVPMQSIGTNDFGEQIYFLELPQGVTYIIFTNGSVQTIDIPYAGGEQKYYPLNANGDGKYPVDNW